MLSLIYMQYIGNLQKHICIQLHTNVHTIACTIAQNTHIKVFFLKLSHCWFFILFFIFYNIVLVSAIQQCKSAIIIHISPPPVPPSPLPISALQVITEHQIVLPVLCSDFLPAIYLTRDRVYVLLPLSPFILLSASSTVFTSLFSTSEPLFLPYK